MNQLGLPLSPPPRRPWYKDLGTQFTRGLGEAGYGLGLGAAQIGDWLTPGNQSNITNSIRHSRDQMRQYYGDAQGVAGTIGSVAGNLVGQAPAFMLGGAAVEGATAGLGEMMTARGITLGEKIAQAVKEPTTMLGKIGQDALFGAPVMATMAAPDAQSSSLGALANATHSQTLQSLADNPLARMAGEVVAGGVGSAALHGAGAALGGIGDAVAHGYAEDAGMRHGRMRIAPDEPPLGDTRVVDPATAEPKQVFHGTSAAFDTFDPARQDKRAMYGPGYYFTEDPRTAGGDVQLDYRAVPFPDEASAVAHADKDWRSSAWKDNNTDTWFATAPKPEIKYAGYAMKSDGKPLSPEATRAVADMLTAQHQRWNGKYAGLSTSERDDMARAINLFSEPTSRISPNAEPTPSAHYGDINTLHTLLSEQPYNIPVRQMAVEEGLLGQPNVRPARLRIETPFRADEVLDPEEDIEPLLKTAQKLYPEGWDHDYTAERLEQRGQIDNVIGEDVYRSLENMRNETGEKFGTTRTNEVLKANGYDGITHMGGANTGNKPHRVWIAFDPDQVRSAFGPKETAARAGVGDTRLTGALGGAAVGGTVGAVNDKDHPLEGALKGAVIGGGLGALAGHAALAPARAEAATQSAVEADKLIERIVTGKPIEPAKELRPQITSDEQAHEVLAAARTQAQMPDHPLPDDFDHGDWLRRERYPMEEVADHAMYEEWAEHAARTLGPDAKRVISEKETAQLADKLGLDDVKDINVKYAAHALAIDKMMTRLRDGMKYHSAQLVEGLQTPEERLVSAEYVEQAQQQMNNLAVRASTVRSEFGRNLQSLKQLARNVKDPNFWLVKARRVANADLDAETMARIVELAKGDNEKELIQTIQKLRKNTWPEKLQTLWKAGLLWAPRTAEANVLGNVAMAGLEYVKDQPAYLFDKLLSMGTKVSTKEHAGSWLAAASRKGLAEGRKEFMQVMRGEIPDSAMQKYDLTRGEVNYESPVLGKMLNAYTKTVFRTLSATDRMFRSIMLHKSLGEQMAVYARISGTALAEPTADMMTRAIADAELATFQNNGVLARIAGGAKRKLREASPAGGALGEIIMPFARTPANIVSRVAEYSPLGFLGTAEDAVKLFGLATSGDRSDATLKAMYDAQKSIVERAGRATTGTAPIVLGYLLSKNGKMTTQYPSDPAERDQWALEGKQPSSVLWHGAWHSVERISPFGNLLALGATMQETDAQGGSKAQVAESGVAGVGKTVLDQSFLAGVDQTLKSVDDPQHDAAKQIKGLVGSIIPAPIAAFARGLDSTDRVTKSPLDAIKSRIPGLSASLPAKVNQFGDDQTHSGGVFAQEANPFYSHRVKTDDPTIAEIARVGAHITRLEKRDGENDADFQARQQMYGHVLKGVIERLVASPRYAHVDEQAKRLVETRPELAAMGAEKVAEELRKQLIVDATRRIRTRLSYATRTRGSREDKFVARLANAG